MTKRGVILLPAGAVVLVALVLTVMFLSGGDDYVPTKPANPCLDRKTGPLRPELEAVAERVVLTGTDEAACKLGVTRERLLLGLSSPRGRAQLAADAHTDQRGLALALVDGLNQAVTRLQRHHELPKVSQLKGQIIDEIDAPGFAKTLMKKIPDSVIDDLLPTSGVLRRSIAKIDAGQVLDEIDTPDELEPRLRKAIEEGAVDEARARLIKKLPGPLDDLF